MNIFRMIESEMMNQMESLTKLPSKTPISNKKSSEKEKDFFDVTDLKQALLNQSGAEVRKFHQQNIVAAQRQIADTCINGVPPKQLLLYLVR